MPERSGNNYFIEGPYLKQPLIEQLQCDLPRALPPRPELQNIQSSENHISNYYDKPFSLINKVNRSLNFDNNKELLKQYKSISSNNEQQSNKQSKIYYHDESQGCKDWLNQYFDGLGNKINWNNNILEEFKDGQQQQKKLILFLKRTLLVQIVEKCETKKLTGVVPKPKTTAACTANVRKVFQTLKIHPQMTAELLFDAEKTLLGNKEFIIKLIKTMKIIYKNLRK